jgi:hypothetical protein
MMSTQALARDEFQRARRTAVIRALLNVIRRRPNDLLSLEQVRARLRVRQQHTLGMRTVDLERIIGSEGRYSDFDRRFAPRNRALRERWAGIARATLEDVNLPAVELIKISDIYFVIDGHHRISVAQYLGRRAIDAHVTELVVDVPLDPTLSMRDLLIKEEYSDFLEWTELADLRPDVRIEFTEPGGYLSLVQHINAHRYYLGLERGAEVSKREAVLHWYDSVYLPVIAALREQQAMQYFPARREADLYRWIMDHRWYLREQTGGSDPGPLVAAADYIRLFGRRGLLCTVQDLLEPLGQALR